MGHEGFGVTLVTPPQGGVPLTGRDRFVIRSPA